MWKRIWRGRIFEAEIVLIYEDERKAEAIAKAISPDNASAPPYMSIETVGLGRKVVTHIRCEKDKFATFVSTIDDLLSCVSVAEKVFLEVKKLT